MIRKNGIRSLIFVLVLLLGVSAWSVAAQEAQHPYLGVRLQDMPSGVVVREVIAESPAAVARIQVEDILTKVNSTSVANAAEAMTAIWALKPGDDIKLDVQRAGQDLILTAKLAAATTPVDLVPNTAPFDAIGYNSTTKMWQVFGLADASALYKAGLRQADQITEINGQSYGVTDLRSWISSVTDTDSVKITVERAGKPVDITVTGTDIKALNLFAYTDQAILFDVVTEQDAGMLGQNLPTNVPFDAFGYTNANQSWWIFGLADHSALYEAGLRPHDQITKFDGKAYDPAAFQTYRQSLADNAMVKITVQRGANSQEITAPAAALNSLDLFSYENSGMLFGLPLAQNSVWLGADAMQINAQLAKQHNLNVTDGMLITGIMPDSPAHQAGLQLNDVITGLGATRLDATHTWQNLLSIHRPGDQVILEVLRGDQTLKIPATLGMPEISGEIAYLMPPI